MYEKNLEQNLGNARINWTSSVSINEKTNQYKELFDDPSRLPYYDEKGGYWVLSNKFNVEENDSSHLNLHHPFLAKDQ